MARAKKAGSYVNVLLKASIYDRLVEHCEKDDRTKTSVIERALTMYFDSLEDSQNDNIDDASDVV